MACCRKPIGRDLYCNVRRRRRRSCRRRRRRRRRRSSCMLPCNAGRITRNPFFNFLRWYRKQHPGWSAAKVAIEGAKCWCQMTNCQRGKFYREACRVPKGGSVCPRRRRRRRCPRPACPRRRRRRRTRCRRRRPPCPRRSHTPCSPCPEMC